MVDVTPVQRRSGVTYWVGAALLTFALVTLLVALLAWIDRVHIMERAEQAHLTFGWPFGWINQDQSAMDPPMPYNVGIGSPLENPSHIRVAPLVLDVAVLWLPLVAILYGVRHRSSAPSQGC